MDKESLKKFVLENPNLVSIKETSYAGLYILKYKKRVFYDNLWNEYLEECRGTIVDADFNVISRPFQKIYNYGIESRAPTLDKDTPVDAWRKINGFMVAISWYDNDILISTTGSTDSDYVKMAKELIDFPRYRETCHRWHDTTFMFECVHRDDPHIIPEKEGLYCIGYRQTSWDSKIELDPKLLKMLAIDFKTNLVEHIKTSLGELIQMSKKVRHEGFVAYTDNGECFKIKSPFYLTSKFLARNPKIDKILDLKNDIKKDIDEEYHGLIDEIRNNIERYQDMDEQKRLEWIREYYSNLT